MHDNVDIAAAFPRGALPGQMSGGRMPELHAVLGVKGDWRNSCIVDAEIEETVI